MTHIECPFAPDVLRDMYCRQGMSQQAIADIAGSIMGQSVRHYIVRRWLDNNGIVRRTPGEWLKLTLAKRSWSYARETRICMYCGKSVTRRRSDFRRPPERTYCCREHGGKANQRAALEAAEEGR